MYTVYVLQDSQGKFYKGMTNDLARRLAEHRGGTTKTTRFMNQLHVVYTEELPDRISARRREKYLKSAAGRRFLQKVLNTGA
ncbi:MAG: GIY-YIG nuclease family protein [Undibacterium sp.]